MASAKKARLALKELDGVEKVYADARLHEVNVVFNNDAIAEETLKKRLEEKGLLVREKEQKKGTGK